jgi:hypothetical protein
MMKEFLWRARPHSLAFALVALSALAFPAVASAPTFIYDGSITLGDPTQTGRMRRDPPASDCGAPQPGAVQTATGLRHYDSYTLHNPNAISKCVFVTIDARSCVGAQFLQPVTYSPSFNPADVAQNYLADPGTAPNPIVSYGFDVPANTAFVIVVHELDPDAGCPDYRVTVEGDVAGGPPTGIGVVSLSATRANPVIVLRWRSASQSQTLGYNVFREQGRERVRANRKLIPATRTSGMHFYRWLDRAAPRQTTRYWLEEVKLNGSRSWHGPARVVR